MKLLKNLFSKTLHALGYDIRKTSHIGLDANADIKRIVGGRPMRTIFDVGAHLGESAVEYARMFPSASIYCFEPSPKTFALLRQNMAPLPHVETFNSAVGDSCSSHTLFVNKFSATNSLLPTRSDVADANTRSLMETTERVEVAVVTLDKFCRDRGIPSIDLLKIDVQGFEAKVIAGAHELLAQECVALIYAEVLFEPQYEHQATFSELYTMLSDSKFQFVDFYSHTRTAHHSTRWCDALFVNSSALQKILR